MRGIHRWPVNSLHKGPVTWKMFLFDDVIMVPYFFLSICPLGILRTSTIGFILGYLVALLCTTFPLRVLCRRHLDLTHCGLLRTISTLVEVTACWLMAPSHYLNQCWFIIKHVWWYPPESNFTMIMDWIRNVFRHYVFKNYCHFSQRSTS